jgi:hypothetical protein
MAVVAGALAVLAPAPARAQTPQFPQSFQPPRMPDGHPNLNGIWQHLGTANWNIEDHSPAPANAWEVGAIGAFPAGQSIIVGSGSLPYTEAGREKQQQNWAKRRTEDPEAKCYMPGIPRANYMPYPFQIVQSNQGILFVYEYASSNRWVNMGAPVEAATDTWMGTNNGRWDGDTLVIDVTGLNGLAWFDRSGNHMSDRTHIVERWRLVSPYHLRYEATIEDPRTFTRPFDISLLLYRLMEPNAQLLEFKCVEFAEDLLYGAFKKEPTRPTVEMEKGAGSR